MNKSVLWISIFIFSSVGAGIPTLFGQSTFGAVSIWVSMVGGFAGIYIAYKLSEYL
jgi:hypothetical protein